MVDHPASDSETDQQRPEEQIQPEQQRPAEQQQVEEQQHQLDEQQQPEERGNGTVAGGADADSATAEYVIGRPCRSLRGVESGTASSDTAIFAAAGSTGSSPVGGCRPGDPDGRASEAMVLTEQAAFSMLKDGESNSGTDYDAEQHTDNDSRASGASASGGTLSSPIDGGPSDLNARRWGLSRERALLLLLQTAEELEAAQEDSKANVPFVLVTAAAAQQDGLLGAEEEDVMWEVQEVLRRADEPLDVSVAAISTAVGLAQLGLRAEKEGDSGVSCACFHEAAVLFPTLPLLLSAALMRLKCSQPLVALPIYTYVLHRAGEGSKELEMARARLDEATPTAATPAVGSVSDMADEEGGAAEDVLGAGGEWRLEEGGASIRQRRPSEEMMLAAAALEEAAVGLAEAGKRGVIGMPSSDGVGEGGEGGKEGGGGGGGETAAGDARGRTQLRAAAAKLTRRIEQLEEKQRGVGGVGESSGWSFRDLKTALVTRLESAEPAVRKGSLELLGMVAASLDRFKTGGASDR